MYQEPETTHLCLRPGEMVTGTSECRIHTLLGSCVSIVLWHPDTKIGMMSHAVVPTRTGKQEFPLDPRYSDEVLTLMILTLEMHGIQPKECWARIYGGSNLFFPIPGQPESKDVGKRNGEIARSQLADHGITIKEESLFGSCYRKLVFDIATGQVAERRMDEDGNPL
jgi:chemotaxis protein CheD